MAGSVNKVILIGNLGRDPETHVNATGQKMVTLSVATSEQWRDRASGERRERTEWHRVVIFDDRLVDVAAHYLRKGAKVYLEGMLATRKWQAADGTDRYTTEVVLKRFNSTLTMLDKRRDGDRSGTDQPAGDGWGGGAADAPPPSGGGPGVDPDLDDEIPF